MANGTLSQLGRALVGKSSIVINVADEVRWIGDADQREEFKRNRALLKETKAWLLALKDKIDRACEVERRTKNGLGVIARSEDVHPEDRAIARYLRNAGMDLKDLIARCPRAPAREVEMLVDRMIKRYETK